MIIEGIRQAERILVALTDATSALKINEVRAQNLLEQGHILATDVANELVRDGMSFREAYTKVAQSVVVAEGNGTQLGRPEMSFESSVEARANCGGTSKLRVRECIEQVRQALSMHGHC